MALITDDFKILKPKNFFSCEVWGEFNSAHRAAKENTKPLLRCFLLFSHILGNKAQNY